MDVSARHDTPGQNLLSVGQFNRLIVDYVYPYLPFQAKFHQPV